jgi:rhodanese-related sulfurtransferase
MLQMGRDSVRAVGVLLVAVLLALVFNAVRTNRLDLVARESFESLIFQPCPETEGTSAEAVVLKPEGGGETTAFPEGTVVVDARPASRYAEGHVPGAVNVVYDELEGVPDAAVEKLKPFKAVVVYCDGWEDEADETARYTNPPSSLLADELKARGLANVSYMEGGLRAHVSRGGRIEKGGNP